MRLEELKAALSAELRIMADKNNRVGIIDDFHIGGYMCSVSSVENFLFLLLDKVFESVDDILDRQIEDCELTVRTMNSLKHNGVHTIGDLIRKSEDEIVRMPCFGKKSYVEICKFLKEHNLRFSDSPFDSGKVWHTGIPAEEGWYICAYADNFFCANYLYSNGIWREHWGGTLLGWQRIEPFKERKI